MKIGRSVSSAIAAHSALPNVHHTPPVLTKEFFVTLWSGYMTATASATGDFNTWRFDGGKYAHLDFKVPHDFTALTHCKIIGIKTTNGTIDWTVNTDFAAIGEASTTHSDSDTGIGLAMTDTEIEEIDISAAFANLAADDYVGVKFLCDAISAGFYEVIGLVFKYS